MKGRLLVTVTCALALGFDACAEKKENHERAAAAASTTGSIIPPMTSTTINPDAKKLGLHQKHKPSIATIVKAKEPHPPADAKLVTIIGKGFFAINRFKRGYVWNEKMDYDDDGIMETADYYYDPIDRITYIYIEKNYTCAALTSQVSAEMLIAVYGGGNRWRKPAGSGWFLAGLDVGECNARTNLLWGCKLTSTGEATECGIATTFVDDIVIIEPTSIGSSNRKGTSPRTIDIAPIPGDGTRKTGATPRK